MKDCEATLRRIVTATESLLTRMMTSAESERGQTLIEGAMVMGFIAILAVTVLTALGGAVGGPLAEVSQVFNPSSGEQANLPGEAFTGARIAD